MAIAKLEDIPLNSDDVEVSKKEKKARKRKKGIYRKIIAQMEFYLSDANLRHSKFLLPIYQKDPWIDLTLFLTFNKVASMLSEITGQEASEEEKIQELVKALSYIESEQITLSECKTKVNRKSPFVPAASTNIDSCTVYAENLPPDADHEFIKNIFLAYGEVSYVSIPKFKSGRSKGFAFIEFKSAESVDQVTSEFTNVTVEKSENLASVKTFNEDREESEVKQQSALGNKRKNEDNGTKAVVKRVKIQEEVQEDPEKEKDDSKMLQGHPSDIQVLSKVVWKKLRNKYLDEQRKNFGAMKHSFKKAHTPRYVETKVQEPAHNNDSGGVDIKPGVVVRIEMAEEVGDPVEFKKLVRSSVDGEKVGYVDVRIGQATAYVRCEDPEQAKKLEGSSLTGAVKKEILKDQEEKDYHKKAAKDKQEKRSGKVKVNKVKTKTKLIQKAESNKNSHVYFD